MADATDVYGEMVLMDCEEDSQTFLLSNSRLEISGIVGIFVPLQPTTTGHPDERPEPSISIRLSNTKRPLLASMVESLTIKPIENDPNGHPHTLSFS
jgi:hypothetical protein